MVLYVIRHGLAGESHDPAYPDDRLRPLTRTGRKRFRATIRALKAAGFRPQMIATSPLVRCRQTGEIVVEELADPPELVELAALEPGSRLEELMAWTNTQALDEVAWLGHAPDVERLTAALIGRGDVQIRFAKGAIAAIDFEDQVVAGRGVLRWLATARLLGA